MTFVCEHVNFNASTAMQFLAVRPGATVMVCPCCGLRGHKDADDTDPAPMLCPYCDAIAQPEDGAA